MCRRCPQVLNWKNLEVMKDQWLHAALKVKWHRDLGQFQEISRKKFAQRGHGNRRAKIWRILAKKSGDFRKNRAYDFQQSMIESKVPERYVFTRENAEKRSTMIKKWMVHLTSKRSACLYEEISREKFYYSEAEKVLRW